MSSMKISVQHLLELIDELPKNSPFDYVKAGPNKAILVSVDFESSVANIDKLKDDGGRKSANMTSDSVNTIANNAYDKVPFSLDSVFNGSGSARSTWEAILANTSEFYTCRINNQKHLVWVPNEPHEIGIISQYEGPFEEPSTDSLLNEEDTKQYSRDEIIDIMVNIYTDPQIPVTAAGGIFVFQYGKHIVDIYSPVELINAAHDRNENIKTRYSAELNAAFLMYKYFRTHSIRMPHNTVSRVKTDEKENSSKYAPYLRALKTKPFLLLAGISGTGKSRIVRELAFKSCPLNLRDKDGTTPGNYLMIEVKPNWHDSSELLGYYSNISKSYHFSKFIDFLVLAHNNKDVPFFVCLDEMNLAPVEQYFAEFLSVLETRKKVGDEIVSGSLVEAKYMKYHGDWGKNEPLTLPSNLFIIGTVNMDDTTHQFSRKVIDRAMTIEMNGGKLSNMFGHNVELEYLDTSNVWPLSDFIPSTTSADAVIEKYPSDADYLKNELSSRLESINSVLENTPFQVSYRVLNELCIYTGVLLEEGISCEEAITEAVDQITLMKILPRIEGDEDVFAVKGCSDNRLMRLMSLFSTESASWKKLKEMNDRLQNGGGFTRFWP